MDYARKWSEILRHERESRNWTQAQIAQALGIDSKRVSEWEGGKTKPSYKYRAKLQKIFKLSAEEFGFLDHKASDDDDDPQEESPEVVGTFPESSPAPPTGKSIDLDGYQPIQLFIPNSTPHVVTIQIQQQPLLRHSDIHSSNGAIIRSEGLSNSSERVSGQNRESDLEMDPGRRKAIKFIATTAAGGTLLSYSDLLNQDTIEHLSASMVKSSNIDTGAVRSLGTITESHWQLVYGGIPKQDLLFSVQGHLQSVTHFLRGSLPISIEQPLYVIASQQAQIMSEIYFDMHDYAKAEDYSKFALDAAQKANNPALYAVALARLSFLYTYSHQFKNALSFLQVARIHAEQSAETTICCWIAAMEAEVQANIFAHYHDIKASDACLRALDRAEPITEQTGDDVFWTKFGSASLAGYQGVCFKLLHEPKKAEHVLLNAIHTISKDVPGGQATMLTDLAAVYAQQGQIEEAYNRATQALKIIAEQNKSVNTLQRVCDFRQELEPWASTSYVQNLDEQIMVTQLRIAPPSL